MTKNFRFLLQSYLPNFAGGLVIGAFILVGCAVTGVPEEGRGLFSGYLSMFPVILHMTAMLSGIALTTTCLNTALSFGALRRDYFRAVCLLLIFNALAFWGMDILISILPRLLGWAGMETLDPIVVSLNFPFQSLLLGALGCAVGNLYIRSQLFAGIITGVCTVLLIMGTPFSLVMQGSPGLWGVLPWLLPVICLCLTAVLLLWVHSMIMIAVVR